MPFAITKSTGDALVGMGTRAMVRAATRYNPHVYQYEFTRISPLAKRMNLNAFHGAYASGESYLEYGDSILLKERLRARYPDALDGIFTARRH